jgi:hypothetical protein
MVKVYMPASPASDFYVYRPYSVVRLEEGPEEGPSHKGFLTRNKSVIPSTIRPSAYNHPSPPTASELTYEGNPAVVGSEEMGKASWRVVSERVSENLLLLLLL